MISWQIFCYPHNTSFFLPLMLGVISLILASIVVYICKDKLIHMADLLSNNLKLKCGRVVHKGHLTHKRKLCSTVVKYYISWNKCGVLVHTLGWLREKTLDFSAWLEKGQYTFSIATSCKVHFFLWAKMLVQAVSFVLHKFFGVKFFTQWHA